MEHTTNLSSLLLDLTLRNGLHPPTSLKDQHGRQMLNGPGVVGVIEKQSCKKIATKAVAGISVLTLKRLSHPLI